MKYSFHRIGTHNGHPVIYTKPASGDLIQTEEQFTGFCQLMNNYKERKWYWVINCRDMGWEHVYSMSFAKRMYEHITVTHKETIVEAWLFNMNAICRTLFLLFPDPRACVMPTDRLELLVTMQKEKASHELTDFCLDLLKAS
jgi:hypothetical protein